MDSRSTDSKIVDSFEMRLAGVRDIPVEHLHALSMSVGWPHRAEDWRFLLDCGDGFVALDEIGRPIGSAMWFPYGENSATIGMVITSPRLQSNGTGSWLMQHVLDRCVARDIRLSATRAARRLYLSLGFQPGRKVYQCQGVVNTPSHGPALDGAQFRELHPDDLAAVAELDARAFGVRRDEMLARLYAHSTGYGLFRNGRLAAFAFCRPFGRGHVVGPVVASTDADAITAVRPHVVDHAGRFLRIDTRSENGLFPAFLSQAGLPIYDTVLSMSLQRGTADPHVPNSMEPAVYALASQALG